VFLAFSLLDSPAEFGDADAARKRFLCTRDPKTKCPIKGKRREEKRPMAAAATGLNE
jgi:hypothetical protein